MTQPAMTRGEAARLLGVPVDAGADAVRHAWRVWARLAHPDAGGDSQHFARLELARRVLLQPDILDPARPGSTTGPTAARSATVEQASVPPDPSRTAWTAPPRAPLASVLHPPARPLGLVVLGVVALALAALPALLGMVDSASSATLEVAVTGMPAALAAAAWAVAGTRAVLDPVADPGHRMTVLALAWLPVCLLQLAVSTLAGAGLITVLPLLALPLVAAVAAVNPGAGLWRPIGTGRSAPVR